MKCLAFPARSRRSAQKIPSDQAAWTSLCQCGKVTSVVKQCEHIHSRITDSILPNLIERLDDPLVKAAKVIPWSCPVPYFGDLSQSIVATLGLNPSNREFVDGSEIELDGPTRRLHTLKSLG